MLVPPEDEPETQENTQTNVQPQIIPNSNLEATQARVDSKELKRSLPSLMTRQGSDPTSRIWLNGEFRTKPWATLPEAPEGPTDTKSCEDSDSEPASSGSETEET